MIRLSHTAMEALTVCERKFQLNRLLTTSFSGPSANPNFAFGHSYEAGCVEFLLSLDKDRALWKSYMAYSGEDEYGIVIPENSKKNEMTAINLVQASFPHLENLLEEWEIATFQGKPATQLSFRVNIDETFYYVGYIDLVLRNRFTGRYAVLDFKTTGLTLLVLDPLYQNSGQLIAYSIVLDEIVGPELSSYDVIYFVGQLGAGNGFQPKVSTLVFPKTLKDRLNFFISLGMDVQRLAMMREYGIFPQRGGSCLQYNKSCFHFGTCGLHSLDKEKVFKEDTTEYQFTFSLDQIIEHHLERT